jgi:hypothetical protein
VPPGWKDDLAEANAREIWLYFLNNLMEMKEFAGDPGAAEIVAAAFLGNFLVESNYWLDPNIKDGRGGLGIAQWTESHRKAHLQDFRDAHPGLPEFEIQKQFAWYELTHSWPDVNYTGVLPALKGLSLDAATEYIRHHYEQADPLQAHDDRRKDQAHWALWALWRGR